MFRICLQSLLVIVALAGTAVAQSPQRLRVATYNLLKYPDADPDPRNASLRVVVAAMRPDVIVSQEIKSAEGVSTFVDDVLDSVFDGRWSAAPFFDASSDTEAAFFYDTTRVSYLAMEVVATELRAMFAYRFALAGSTDTVWIYSVHLKASDTPDDRLQRAEEAAHLRRHLDSAHAGEHVIVAGDFNTYASDEPALTVLFGEEGNAAARLVDPLASVGDWHANPDFAPIHTQSPRTTQFGGGVHGGLDDRFDMILVSTSLSSVIDRGSYEAFGNDGNHFNRAINELPNAAVPDSVAQALHDGSDHLPVVADFQFVPAVVPAERAALALRVAPMPGSDHVRFELAAPADDAVLVVRNLAGIVVARASFDEGASVLVWDCSSAPSGIYTFEITSSAGRAAGTVVITH